MIVNRPVKVWGCMSTTGVEQLQFVSDVKYITKLETRMLPSAKEMLLEGDFVFQGDSV